MNLYDTFLEGMRKGLKIAALNMLPNVVVAFVLIKALQITGLLDQIGTFFTPVMQIFHLPGEAVTVLLSTFLSAGGGVGAAAGLYSHEVLNSVHLSILMPAIFLMGAQVQYAGRILGVIGIKSKHFPALFLISLVNALMAMLTMAYFIV